jgi:hypothetical protein
MSKTVEIPFNECFFRADNRISFRCKTKARMPICKQKSKKPTNGIKRMISMD